MTHDPRYDFAICPECNTRWQLIDWGCALHANSCPGAFRAPPTPQPATEPTEQGNQFVIPGCERDKSRGPAQLKLW